MNEFIPYGKQDISESDIDAGRRVGFRTGKSNAFDGVVPAGVI